MKKIVRLTESDIRNMVMETVTMITENGTPGLDPFDIDYLRIHDNFPNNNDNNNEVDPSDVQVVKNRYNK